MPGGGVSTGEGESFSFTLPSFPVSFNQLYTINHLQRKVTLSDEALLWRTRTVPFVKPCRWPVQWLLKLTLVYESPNWVCKNGKLRRMDHQNLDKLVVDTMFAKWGRDDSRLVEIVSRKRYGPREQIQVTIERCEVNLNGNH